MFDIICTQRIMPGTEVQVEELLRQAEVETLAHDKGCERYEWYRQEPNTYILIERWTDRDAAIAHFRSRHMTRVLEALNRIVPEKFTISRLTRLEKARNTYP